MFINDSREKTMEKVENLNLGIECKTGRDIANSKNLLYAVPQSDVTVKICEGIIKLKNAKVDRYISNRASITLESKNQDVIAFEIDDSNNITNSFIKVSGVDEVLKNIRASQIQLFQYILYQYNQEGFSEIKINISEFFKLRNIKRRKENMDRFLQDISILSYIGLDMVASYKGKHSREISKLLKVKGVVYSGKSKVVCEKDENSKIKYIVVELGVWSKKIKLRQFVYLGECFFKYNSKTEWMVILISIKMGQLVKTNRQKIINKGYWNCKISTVISYLGITEADLIKQGYKYYHKIFTGVFNALKREGYDIKLNPVDYYKTTEDFIKGNIAYRNDIALTEYKSIRKVN